MVDPAVSLGGKRIAIRLVIASAPLFCSKCPPISFVGAPSLASFQFFGQIQVAAWLGQCLLSLVFNESSSSCIVIGLPTLRLSFVALRHLSHFEQSQKV